MPRKGAIFVFEGPDGVGKTTLLEAVRQVLVRTESSVLIVSFPGRDMTTLGGYIYQLHHRPVAHPIRHITPDALQVLHVAAHIDTIQSVIRPHIETGGIVLLDRYWWSTWVYGRLSGVDPVALEKMIAVERNYWTDLFPVAIFLIRRSADAFGLSERGAFLERTREYDSLLGREALNSRVIPIENSRDVNLVASDIAGMIKRLLRPKRNRTGEAGPTSSNRIGKLQSASQLPRLPFDLESTDSAPCHAPSNDYALTVWSKLAPAKPTIVYDTYWRFATERQEIFFNRFNGRPRPWTHDPILDRYKFTNAYRASDRVSQYLIRRVIYRGPQSPRELFFRIILFKLFNLIDTWERLEAAFGELSSKEFDPIRYDRVLTAAMDAGATLYSGAYIMPSGDARWREDRKHRMHLRLLEYMLSLRLPERVASASSMQEVFELLKSIPTIGDFLAYQFATDLNYSSLTDFDECEFVIPGPGAKSGIRKCFSTLGGLNESDLIKFIRDRQDDELELRSLRFRDLWGRPLQLVDCQNLFCEVDKYSRVYHPNIKGTSERTRIKQQFRPSTEPISYWYPPKWGLNDRVTQELEQVS